MLGSHTSAQQHTRSSPAPTQFVADSKPMTRDYTPINLLHFKPFLFKLTFQIKIVSYLALHSISQRLEVHIIWRKETKNIQIKKNLKDCNVNENYKWYGLQWSSLWYFETTSRCFCLITFKKLSCIQFIENKHLQLYCWYINNIMSLKLKT